MTLDKEIEEAAKKLNELERLKTAQMKSLMVECASCHQGIKVGDVLVRLHQYYVEPYSCTGGDYWTLGDNPDRSFVCPHCNVTNRLFGHYSSSSYQLLRPYLKHETVYALEEKNWINTHA